jgi:hypothetical protein
VMKVDRVLEIAAERGLDHRYFCPD